MKNTILWSFFNLLAITTTFAQVKAGDNPNQIDGTSLLELESTDKVFVVTRVTTVEMNAITPLSGALVYNTDENCLFQYSNSSWTSLCIDVMANETVTSITDNSDGTFSHTNESGAVTTITKARLTDNGNGTFTFSNNDGNDITISVSALETLTQVTDNSDGTYTYTNEQGILQTIDTRALSNPYDNSTSTLTSTSVQDAITEIANTKGTITSTDIIVGNGTDAALKNVTLDIADDVIDKDKINADIAGTGLTQATDGSLEVNVSAIDGDGSITSPNSSVTLTGTPDNSLLENVGFDINVDNVTLEIDPANGVQVKDDAITNAKVADNAINTENIIDGQVQTDDIEDANVTTAKVLDKNITPVKIENGTANQVLKTNDAGTDVEWGTLDATNITGEDLTAGDGSITVMDGTGATLVDSNVRVTDGGITTVKVADDAVTNAKVADNAVSTENITDGQVQTDDIADANVTTAKIADNNVTTAKILDKNITPAKIENGTANQVLKTNAAGTDVEWGTLDATNITGEDLTAGDGSITVTDGTGATLVDSNVRVTDGGITTVKVADDAVTNAKVADNAVSTENITDGQVQTDDIADANVTTAKIADNNVTTAKVLDKNITPAKIENGAANQVLKTNAAGTNVEWGTLDATNITGEDLTAGDGSITVTDGTGATLVDSNVRVTDGGITTVKIANDAITNAKVADNAINTENITDGQIQNSDLLDGTVTSSKIADGTIATIDIANDAIDKTKINGDIAGLGLTQAGDGSLQVDIANVTGDGTLTSPNSSITLTGLPVNSLLENVGLDINVDDTTLEIDPSNGVQVKDIGITTAKIANTTVTPAKIASGTANQVLKTNVAGTAVEWGTLDATNITGEDLTAGDGSIIITTGNGATLIDTNVIVAPDGITNAKIAEDAIQTENIVDGTITTVDISSGGNDKILTTDSAGVVTWQDKAINEITEITGLQPTGKIIGTYTNEANANFDIRETITSLSQNTGTGVITFNKEDATTNTANVVDNALTNNITSGANGGAFYDDPDDDPSNEFNTAFSILNVAGTDFLRISDGGGDLDLALSDFAHTGIAGSVFFAGADGKPTENNAQIFYDEANTRLFLGPRLTNNINNELNVNGSTRTGGLNNANGTVGLPSYRFTDDSNTGFYRPVADQLGFVTGGIEALRIDNSQNVGIGVSVPDESLHIGRNMRLDGAFEDKDGDAGTVNQILVSTATGTDWVDITSVETNTTLTGTNPTGNTIGTYNNEAGGTPVDINETITTLTGIGSTLTYTNEIGSMDLTNIVRAVNGVDPGADGNVAVILSSVTTGLLANLPATGVDADIYVVSGEVAPNTDNNGITFIYNEDPITPSNSGWVEITTDLATTDGRYVNIIGDAMTGPLSMGANAITDLSDPVNLQDAATKNYVDNQVGALNTLPDGLIYIGDNTNQANEVAIGGDATLNNIGELTIIADAIDKTKINGDIAGTGLTQAIDGSLEVNVAAIAGDGSITSPNSSITLTGTTANSILENVGFDVNVDDASIEVDATNGLQVKDLGIGTTKIANTAVTPAKIANGTTNQILKTNAAGTAVEWGLLDATNIDKKDLTAGDPSITVTTGTGATLVDTNITVTDAGITTVKLGPDAVTNPKIADDAIQTENILNGTIAPIDIASGGNDKVLTTDSAGVVTWTDKVDNEITTITGLSTTGNTIGTYNNEDGDPFIIRETLTFITDTNAATNEKEIATYADEDGGALTSIYETVTDINEDENVNGTNDDITTTAKRVLEYEDENGNKEEYITSITGQSFDEDTDILTISEGGVNTALDFGHLGDTWKKQGTIFSADPDDIAIYKSGTVGIGDFSGNTIDANLHVDGTGTLVRVGETSGTKIDLITSGNNTTLQASSAAGTGNTTIATDGGSYVIKGNPATEQGQLQMQPYQNENTNFISNKAPQAGLAVETDGDVVMVPVIYATGKVTGDGSAPTIYNATVVKGPIGNYRINFDTPLIDSNYIIQLTVLDCGGNCPPIGGNNYDDPGISYANQDGNGFDVNIGDSDNGSNPQINIDQEFMFTVIRLPGIGF